MTDLSETVKNHTNIVFRLRASFLVIVLLLCIGGLLGGYQIYRLLESQRQAIEYSVPTLAKSQQFESYLAKIVDFSARLGAENSKIKVLSTHSSLIELSNFLNDPLESKNLIASAPHTNTVGLEHALGELSAVVRDVVPVKIKILETEQRIYSKSRDVVRLRNIFNQLVEPVSIDLASNLDSSLNYFTENTYSHSSKTLNSLKLHMNDQHQLLEISLRMSALLDTIEHLSPNHSERKLSEASASLNIDFRRITQHLVNFNNHEIRNQLAKIVKQLRAVVFSENGLINDISTHVTTTGKFDTTHNSLLSIVNSVSNHIDDIVNQAKNDIDSTTLSFNQILKQTVVILSFIGIFVFMLIALINYFVVERQINRRMSTLISAVIDIANGDTGRNVGITGQDEIALMADALEIFKDNATELRRSNHELEQFAYAASHDLKSPLNAIEHLAQWVLEDAEDVLPDESKENLQRLLTRAQRLSRLQSDLLEYSRADKVDSSVDQLDLENIISEIADFLDPEHKFNIQVTQFSHRLTTRITPLRQILLNLVDNAIKHHDRTTGSIEIDARIKENKLLISVTDDGPGIPERYHKKIFALFEKLESKDVVEGSGLGLSLVHKLIEQSKGSISVFSDPETKRGCKFEFEWSVDENPLTQS